MSLGDRIEALGAALLQTGRIALDLIDLFASTVTGVFHGQRRPGELVQQMYLIGNKSLFFIAVTLGFIGMVMVYQVCLQLNNITGDLSMVGVQYSKIVVQEVGATLTAMMLATRVGAGIAAEIGSMKVTEQIDALRMSGVTPVDYLIVPRFLASIVMTLALAVFGALVAFTAGGFAAWLLYDVNPRIFFDISQVGFAHLGLGITKALAYGMAIPVIAGYCGLNAQGSSEGVGRATTTAVIGGTVAVLLLDFIISSTGLVLLGEYL